MFRFLVLLASLAVLASARRRFYREVEDPTAAINANLFNGCPDCKKAFGDEAGDFTFEGCSEDVMSCFTDVRGLLKDCITNEIKEHMTNPQFPECRDKHRDLFKEWFHQICKTKMDVKRCMDGETAPEHEGDEEHMEHEAREHEGPPKHMKHFKHACWASMMEKYKDCKAKAMEGCNDKYKTCTGKMHSDDAELDKWFAVAKHNKHEIGHKIHHAQHHMKKCLAGEAGHETHDHGHLHSSSEEETYRF